MRNLNILIITIFILLISKTGFLYGKENILFINTFTGKYVHFGTQAENGISVFFNNQENSFLKKNFNLIRMNIDCEEKYNSKLIYEIEKYKPKLIINSVCPKFINELAAFYEKNKILNFWVGISREVSNENNLKYFFRISPKESNQSRIIIKFISEKYKNKNIALIHEENQKLNSSLKQYKNLIKRHNLNLKFIKYINDSKEDFKDIILKTKEDKIELFIVNFKSEFILEILEEINKLNLKLIIIANDEIANPKFSMLIKSLNNLQIYYSFSDYYDRNYINAERYLSSSYVTDSFHPYKDYTYILLEILDQALQINTNQNLEDYLKQNSFNTIYGNLSFIKSSISYEGYKLLNF